MKFELWRRRRGHDWTPIGVKVGRRFTAEVKGALVAAAPVRTGVRDVAMPIEDRREDRHPLVHVAAAAAEDRCQFRREERAVL